MHATPGLLLLVLVLVWEHPFDAALRSQCSELVHKLQAWPAPHLALPLATFKVSPCARPPRLGCWDARGARMVLSTKYSCTSPGLACPSPRAAACNVM